LILETHLSLFHLNVQSRQAQSLQLSYCFSLCVEPQQSPPSQAQPALLFWSSQILSPFLKGNLHLPLMTFVQASLPGVVVVVVVGAGVVVVVVGVVVAVVVVVGVVVVVVVVDGVVVVVVGVVVVVVVVGVVVVVVVVDGVVEAPPYWGVVPVIAGLVYVVGSVVSSRGGGCRQSQSLQNLNWIGVRAFPQQSPPSQLQPHVL
jgi:hypothetical protein